MHGLNWILAGITGGAALIGVARLLARPVSRAAPRGSNNARVRHSLETQVAQLGEIERRILSHVLHRERTARDASAEFEEHLTLGERMADRLASFGGSWTFIAIFASTLFVWIGYNVERAAGFDPFPFILLNLVLSCLAAVQAPVILMSQNRMSAMDRTAARHDYEVNLKAEMEIMGIHAKLDDLQQREWARLLEIQDRQIAALARIEHALAARLDSND
jgi:uncharacterized membrane protein